MKSIIQIRSSGVLTAGLRPAWLWLKEYAWDEVVEHPAIEVDKGPPADVIEAGSFQPPKFLKDVPPPEITEVGEGFYGYEIPTIEADGIAGVIDAGPQIDDPEERYLQIVHSRVLEEAAALRPGNVSLIEGPPDRTEFTVTAPDTGEPYTYRMVSGVSMEDVEKKLAEHDPQSDG